MVENNSRNPEDSEKTDTTDKMKPDSATRSGRENSDKPDWFGAYAPAEHVRDAKGGIAYGGEKEVKDLAATLTRSGAVIVDADTASDDTVRLVYDREDLEALHDMLGDLLDESGPNHKSDGAK